MKIELLEKQLEIISQVIAINESLLHNTLQILKQEKKQIIEKERKQNESDMLVV